MRLLLRNDAGGFNLTKDLVGDDIIPPYAILSHTWKEGEEVTFKDLMDGTGQGKSGYDKIRFCGQEAERDNLQYFWVDTCCIDKSNHVELQDAINSMFRWYQNATKCYVYLSDVSTAKRKASDEHSEYTWETAYQESRWFTRGWTLQELLAPRSVEFFSREGKQLGNKRTLEQKIHDITGIAVLALQGSPLSQFSVEDRLLWAKGRQTTRKEDKAYSLLGIFGIYMLPNYGEGEENAFRRLRKKISKSSSRPKELRVPDMIDKEDRECVQHLRLTDPRDDKKRIEETKGGLLVESYDWILGNSDFNMWRDDQEKRLLWIMGDPGKGKTMLLCGIVDELKKLIANTDLLAYFFCESTDSRLNNATAVLRGLLYLLVNQQPSTIMPHIRKKYDHAGKALFEDANAWVALSEIFTDILQDPSLNNTYLIVDALDECVAGFPKLLHFIAQKSSVSSRVKWIVSCRNRPDIEEHLQGHTVKLSLELNADSISTAVSIFIQHRLLQLAEKKKYNEKTQKTVLDHLSSNAKDTFLWVALVCQNLEKVPRWNIPAKLNTFPPGLDSLYARMMQDMCASENASLCKRILAFIAIVYQPITLIELTSLVEELEGMADDLESLQEIIRLCGSFLTFRGSTIYFIHQSAKEFLLLKAFDKIFPSGKEEVHYVALSRSLQVMSRTLRRDIYSLHALGYPAERVKQPDPDPLAAARYSCIFWVDHLYDCDFDPNSSPNHQSSVQDGGAVDEFMRKKYLYWLEALSLCKSMSEGVVALAKLETLIQGRKNSSAFVALVRDARRFIMYHKWAIEHSPLQAYTSALIFSPARSLIRVLFKEEAPKWITLKPGIRDEWGACLQTLEEHSSTVNSIAFSHDSALLASGSDDETVKIWDSSSGKCLQTLENHNKVKSVAFSHDSTRLLSGLADGVVHIWNVASGQRLQTLRNRQTRNDCSVRSVAFSHDSTLLASGSNNETIRIWDSSSGKCLRTIETYSEVKSVAFSHDSTRLVSGLAHGVVNIWNVANGQCLRAFKYQQISKDHPGSAWSVNFSNYSAQVASGVVPKLVMRDTSSSERLRAFYDRSNLVLTVTFSDDLTRFASVTLDRKVKIWDISSGECLQTFKGHSGEVSSVIFSHDSTRLASASSDATIKIWNVSSDEWPHRLNDRRDSFGAVTFSPNLAWFASVWNRGPIKIWETRTGECLQTLHCVGFYPKQSITFSHDSTKLASFEDEIVKIWDTSNGEYLHTLRSHCHNSSSVHLVVFSHDSTKLASAAKDGIIDVWDTTSGQCLQTFKDFVPYSTTVAFSSDSTRLALASIDNRVRILDVNSGECLHTFRDYSGEFISVHSVTFSHDSAKLALAAHKFRGGTIVKIRDTTSGECLQTLRFDQVFSNISFDTTGSYLHTGIGTIATNASLSAPSMTPTIAESQNPWYQDWALTSDGEWITYKSENVVWVPSEYRPRDSTVSGKTICVRYGSGDVLVYDFEPGGFQDFSASMSKPSSNY